ncbi:neprilysin-2-like [Amblyomma americanum]
MQPGNQPVGNPPPGYRYRVVEIPLDQVFADSMSSLAGFGEEGTELQYRQYVQQLQQAGLEEYLRQQYLDPQLQQAMMQQQILQQQLMQQQMMQQQMMQQEQMAAAGLGVGVPGALRTARPPTMLPPFGEVVPPPAEPHPRPLMPGQIVSGKEPITSGPGTPQMSELRQDEEEVKEMIEEMMVEDEEGVAGMLISLLPAFLLLLLFIPLGILFFVQTTITVVECSFKSCVDDGVRFDEIIEHASVSACRDFYEHTCAHWRDNNPVPEFATRFSYLDYMRMRIEEDISNALKGESQKRARTITTAHVSTMVDIYRGCLNEQDASGGKEAMRDLEGIIFGRNATVTQVLARTVLKLGIDTFFAVRFRRSDLSYPRNYLELDFPNLVIQPENFLTKSLVLKEPDRRLLVQASQEMFRALQLPSSQYRDRADQLVSMVKAVAGRILFYKPTTIEHPVTYRRLSQLLGSNVLNWLDFFTEVTQHSVPRLTYTMVRLVNGPYLTTLNAFLDAQAYPTGNRDNFLDYVRLLIFLNFAVSLPSLPQLNEVYWRYGHDMHKAPERWRLCLRFIDEILPRALSWFYHRYHLTLRVAKEPFTVLLTPLTQGTVQEHLETVEALKDVFGIFLGNADWLPYNMRIDGSTKLEKMRVVMFFTPNIVQGDAISIPPPSIDVDGNNIAKAAVEARKVEVSDYYNYSIFLEKGEQFGPPYKVLDMNCHYNYGTNTLYVPHVLFHGHLFSEGERNLVYLPKLLHIIGLGMGKALDPHGTRISSEPEDADWLWGAARTRWENYTACFRNIYNVLEPKFRMQGTARILLSHDTSRLSRLSFLLFLETSQVDANRTFAGNLVDSMALQAALWYYRRRAKEAAHPQPDFQLPKAKNLSSDAIFFYSFGEYMCEVLSPNANRKLIDFGLLPPNHVRLNTLLRHMPDFATAFECPPTSEMVLQPPEYCVPWPSTERYIIRPADAFSTTGGDVTAATN